MQIDNSIKSILRESTLPPANGDYEAVYRMSPAIDLSELHRHEYYEIYFHIRGGRMMYVNGASYEMKTSTFIVFPPGCLHGFIGGREMMHYERAFLYITGELMRTLGNGILDFEGIINKYFADKPRMLDIDGETLVRCIHLIRMVAENPEKSYEEKRMSDLSCITLLLLQVKSALSRQVPERPERVAGFADEIRNYIDENFTQKLTLSQMAEHFAVSQSLICHKFSNAFGESVYGYVLRKRVNYARELIETGMSSTQAAYKSGFGSYSNFLRAFEKYDGRSPRKVKTPARITESKILSHKDKE